MKRSLIFVAKFAVTIGFLAWVIGRTNLTDVGSRLRTARLSWLILAAVFTASNICLGALRWRLILRALKIDFPIKWAMRFSWSAQFFNTFLPTGVVGDALRCAWTARRADSARAILSIVLDRVAALVALAFIVGVGQTLPAVRLLGAAPFLAVASVLIGIPAVAFFAFPDKVVRFATRVGGVRIALWTRNVISFRALTVPLCAGPRWGAVGLAVILHALVICAVMAEARAASVSIPSTVLVAVVPAVMVTTYVPVSISGIGVRDAAFVELLGQAGVSASDALAISVLFLVVNGIIALVGGLVYLTTGRAKKTDP